MKRCFDGLVGFEGNMGKKKKAHTPRRKRMRKASRLQSVQATRWVEKYTGKNIVRGYCKWYGVDELCAVIELRQLGVPIPAELEAELREKAAKRNVTAAGRKQAKRERDAADEHPDSDATFAFIAGYTPAGFPYGTTWEELGRTPTWIDDEEREHAGDCRSCGDGSKGLPLPP